MSHDLFSSFTSFDSSTSSVLLVRDVAGDYRQVDADEVAEQVDVDRQADLLDVTLGIEERVAAINDGTGQVAPHDEADGQVGDELPGVLPKEVGVDETNRRHQDRQVQKDPPDAD